MLDQMARGGPARLLSVGSDGPWLGRAFSMSPSQCWAVARLALLALEHRVPSLRGLVALCAHGAACGWKPLFDGLFARSPFCPCNFEKPDSREGRTHQSPRKTTLRKRTGKRANAQKEPAALESGVVFLFKKSSLFGHFRSQLPSFFDARFRNLQIPYLHGKRM